MKFTNSIINTIQIDLSIPNSLNEMGVFDNILFKINEMMTLVNYVKIFRL